MTTHAIHQLLAKNRPHEALNLLLQKNFPNLFAKASSRLIDGYNDSELCLYAVVGYFRASGYFPLRESLKKL